MASTYRQRLMALATPFDEVTKKRTELAKLYTAGPGKRAHANKLAAKLFMLKDDPLVWQMKKFGAGGQEEFSCQEVMKVFAEHGYLLPGLIGSSHGPIVSGHTFLGVDSYFVALVQGSANGYSHFHGFGVSSANELLEMASMRVNMHRFYEPERFAIENMLGAKALENREKHKSAVTENLKAFSSARLSAEEIHGLTCKLNPSLDFTSPPTRFMVMRLSALSSMLNFSENEVEHTLNCINSIARGNIAANGIKAKLPTETLDNIEAIEYIEAIGYLAEIAFGDCYHAVATLLLGFSESLFKLGLSFLGTLRTKPDQNIQDFVFDFFSFPEPVIREKLRSKAKEILEESLNSTNHPNLLEQGELDCQLDCLKEKQFVTRSDLGKIITVTLEREKEAMADLN